MRNNASGTNNVQILTLQIISLNNLYRQTDDIVWIGRLESGWKTVWTARHKVLSLDVQSPYGSWVLVPFLTDQCWAQCSLMFLSRTRAIGWNIPSASLLWSQTGMGWSREEWQSGRQGRSSEELWCAAEMHQHEPHKGQDRSLGLSNPWSNSATIKAGHQQSGEQLCQKRKQGPRLSIIQQCGLVVMQLHTSLDKIHIDSIKQTFLQKPSKQ